MLTVDNDLPEFFSSFLSYLADCLPPPVYTLVTALLSRAFAFLSSLLALFASLASLDPIDWDIKPIIPPLIGLLCAYLALLTLYRTTTWFIRTTIWFFKWGFILSVIFTGMGWYLHDAGERGGAIANIQDTFQTVFEAVNIYNPGQVGDMRSNPNIPRTGSHSSATRRPRPWDSYETHKNQQRTGENDELPNQISMEQWLKVATAMTGDFVEQGGQWWKAARAIMKNGQTEEHVAGQGGKYHDKGTKSRSR
ncbi:hypothetical protein AX17_005732 [Amanita inopinata Kibby_2008]|nr:hypothetical protein AX17_005732 [Amanita inopinata Kibby_2008]